MSAPRPGITTQRLAGALSAGLLALACGAGDGARPADASTRREGAPAVAGAPSAPSAGVSSEDPPANDRPAEERLAEEQRAKKQPATPSGPGSAGEGASSTRTPSAGSTSAASRPADGGSPSGADGAGEPRADRFADLELLCAALRRDYVDGTLTDYYRGLRPRTAFGADLLRRGEASMHPGRLLEAALRDMAKKPGDPATPACDALVGELDELE
ncbi:MAG: hypothetical protein R3B09_01265 [Nannocystaceae bacterium]